MISRLSLLGAAFTLRSKTKVSTSWWLYCLAHNIEKLAHRGYG